jgi:hypothetical protein
MQTELKIQDEYGNGHNHMLPAVSLGSKKAKCYNCKFAGQQFKVSNVTHLHCEDEKQYPKEKWESGELTAWDSLQKFSDTCKFHEFKDSVVK